MKINFKAFNVEIYEEFLSRMNQVTSFLIITQLLSGLLQKGKSGLFGSIMTDYPSLYLIL